MKAIETTPRLEFAPEWDRALLQVNQAHPSIALNEIEQRAFSLVAGRWIAELHWVVRKKWLSKHKIPISPRYVKNYEPGAEVLYSLLEMAIQAHAVGYGSEYSNAGQWFAQICIEEMDQEIKEVIAPNRNLADAPPTKSSVIEETGRQVAWMSMRQPKNPLDPVENLHLWRLIEASLQLRRESDQFDAKFWKPYLRSLRVFERSLKMTSKEKGKASVSLYGVLFVRDDRVFTSFGNQIRPLDCSIRGVPNFN